MMKVSKEIYVLKLDMAAGLKNGTQSFSWTQIDTKILGVNIFSSGKSFMSSKAKPSVLDH